MPENLLKAVADKADMIIRGYAFTREGDVIRVLNLNGGESSMVLTSDGTMIETNMDEIEQALVMRIWNRDCKYMAAETIVFRYPRH